MDKHTCEEIMPHKCKKVATRVAYPVDDCVKLKAPVYVCSAHSHSFDAGVALGTNRFWKPTEVLKTAPQASPSLLQ